MNTSHSRKHSILRAGLIGYGLAGRFLHAPLVTAAGINITGVVTRRANEAREDYPQARIFESAEALCSSPEIDLVIVVTPDDLHAAHARTALEAGKHVVIDKPFALNSADALDLMREAEKRALLLTVFHNRRWDNDFLTVKKLAAEGALGDIMHYAARWDRFRPNAKGDWRDEHMLGELYGLGSHLVDQVLVLFGDLDWLVADVYKQRNVPGHSDGFEILMGKGRLRITLGVNLLAADELRSYRVLGTQAAFSKHGLDPQEAHLRARGAVAAPNYGVEEREIDGRLIPMPPNAEQRICSERGDWLAFYRGVRAALETGAPAPVSALEAARCIAILEAAMASSNTGQRIDIPQFLRARGVGA